MTTVLLNPYRFAAPALPLTIAGLKAWWKADGVLWQDSAQTIPATAQGDRVGAADDASGLLQHMLQATANDRPTLNLNVYNGNPTLRFNGSNHVMHTAAVVSTLTNNFTMIVVAKQTGAANQQIALSNGSAANGLCIAPNCSANFKGFLRPGIQWDDTTVGRNNTNGVYVGIRAAGVTTLYLDGAALTPTFAGAPATPTTRTSLGMNSNLFFNGDVSEALMYDAALSTPDRQALEAYLKAKWGTP